MRKFLSLTLNIARDVIRQPVIAILTVAGIITMGMLPVMGVFTLGQEERIVRDGVVAACFVFGLFVVVASSVASISGQIRDGTAGSVLCKPVSREMFLSATYCGILLVCLLFTAIAVTVAMLSVRMAFNGIYTDWLVGIILAAALILALAAAGAANYRGHNFCSALFKAILIFLLLALFITAFLEPEGGLVPLSRHDQNCAYCQGPVISSALLGHFGEFIQWQMAPAALLLFGALAMLSAIAVALSTRFTPVVVFFCCCLIFILGLISDYLLFTLAGGGFWAELCAAILPNWQYLWVNEALDGGGLTPGYILKACGYAALYIGGVLCLGILSFKSVDT